MPLPAEAATELLKASAEATLITDARGRKTIRHIMLEDGKLFYGVSKERCVELSAESFTVFFIKNSPGSIEFEMDKDRNVDRMVLKRSDGTNVSAERIEE